MSVAANRYARALMDVLYPESAEAGLEQLESFNALLKDQPDGRRLLENPTFAGDRRKRLLKEISDALGLDRRVANFVGILTDRNRLSLLDELIVTYQKLLDERMGIVRAIIKAARPLDASEQRKLSGKLEQVTGKQVRMEIAVDPSLIGGVVAQVGSTVYDGSVRQQLNAFKSRLIEE
ncbi:MAG TPA: ATP synthase F1 subunit delta [Terriglobia bacterium]|nr:ATP synthase F1 subunit delta [Terriglobia bacterium]